jgi:glucokinase
MFSRLAKEGDPVALKAFDKTANPWRLKLADAVAHTSPEAIFLTGGVAKAGDFLLKPTNGTWKTICLHLQDKVKLIAFGMKQAQAQSWERRH